MTTAKLDHDALYHRFFSDPAIVAQLLREFVAGPWLDGLDLDGLERLNTKFHADTGERRESDLVCPPSWVPGCAESYRGVIGR